MSQPVQPDEAASALSEVRRQQEQVINSVMVPGWYWWVTAALVVGLGGAVDSHRHVVLAVVIPVFVACVAILTGSMIFGGYHRAQIRGSDLLGPRGALAIMTFVWLLVGGVLGVAFALRAEHLRYPATIATVIGAVVLVAGGPGPDAFAARHHASQPVGGPAVTVGRFDELIHAPTRLAIVSLLAATEWADFSFIRDGAGLSDSALSKQLTTLEQAGYVEIRKGSSVSGRAPR